MSKSKCKICGKPLKAGEWVLKKHPTQGVIKVCNDVYACQDRVRQNKLLYGKGAKQ